MDSLLNRFGKIVAPFGDRGENFTLFRFEPKVKTYQFRSTRYGKEGPMATKYFRDGKQEEAL